MGLEIKFLTADEITASKPSFNPEIVSEEYLTQIVSELGEKPVWYEKDISEKPKQTAGLSICRECRQIYWVTQLHDAYKTVRKQGQVIPGPFCERCL
jgi:hypothetical protein